MLNGFERAGDAMIQAQEGNRLIAEAIWKGLRGLAGRVGRSLASMLSAMPGTRQHP